MRAPLVTAVIVLAAGIVVGGLRLVPLGDGPFLLSVPLAGAAVALSLARPDRSVGHGRGVLAVLGVAGLVLGTTARVEAHRSCAAWLPADLPVAVHGVLLERRGDRARLGLRGAELGGVMVPCEGEVSVRDATGLEVGTAVRIAGRWWRPPGASNGLRPVGLLMADSATVAPASAVAEGPDRRWGSRRLVETLRTAGRRRVEAVFGTRAPLAASLLLAQRDGLDRDVRDRFARAGLSHLLAISGLHVGLVAGILMLTAGAARLGREQVALAAGAGTVAYVLFLGAPHSAARAALQIVLLLGARVIQRPARTEALIATAALVLLALDPASLFSPGFQLSFAGVAGILALRRPLLRRLGGLAGRRVAGVRIGAWLADGLATSVAATAATAPIVAWHFGRVAPVGIVANLVAIPLLGLTVPALALAALAGTVWIPAGRFLAGSGAVFLDALNATATAAAGVPGGTVPVPASAALVVTGAVGLATLVTRRMGRVRRGVRVAAWTGVVVAVVAASPVRPAKDQVELHVIDVGQGDAVAIRSPAGRWLLVDAGVATDGYDAGARVVVPYLARRGVQRLEGLVVTHPDADHMGGAGAVIRTLRPRWVTDPGFRAPKTGYLALLRAASQAGVHWFVARQGMELQLDGMVVEFLHPWGAVESDDANDASVVLRVVYGAFEALLTGDAPAEVERALVRRVGGSLEADVLKAGHHGSNTSTSPELLGATGARVALISAGRGNRYGHPHRAVVERLEAAGLAILRTDRQGSIVVRGTRAGAISTEAERSR